MGKFQFSLPGLKKSNLAVGLDIGSHAIKICELAESGKSCRLLKLGSAILPEGAVEDGVLQEPDAVGAIIAELFKNLKIKNKKVAISISGYSVIVKKINLAVMDQEELAEHITAEAEQYIPFDIDEVFLDFQDLKTSELSGSDRTDVMLVAAKKEVVNGYLEMLEKIGLTTVVVDVDAFALENSFEKNFPSQDNVVLVDIGASKMSINIISHGASILARDVVLGSRQLTDQIQSRFDTSMEEAEDLKIGKVPPEDKREQLENIFTKTIGHWVLEIQKALEFYYSTYPEDTIHRLVLSGGGAKVKGLDAYLNKETGIETEIFNPFTRIEFDPKKIDPMYVQRIAPEMAISAGLATRPSLL